MTRQPKPNEPTHRVKAQRGFTLVELMVTIAVMGIIATMAAPSMNRAIANQRVKSTATTLESALAQAKAESTITQKNIKVKFETSSDNKNTLIKVVPLKPRIDSKTGAIIKDSNGKIEYVEDTPLLATYTIDSRSSVSPQTDITLSSQPNADADVTYTVCDNASIEETPIQVSIIRTAKITMKQAGTCS